MRARAVWTSVVVMLAGATAAVVQAAEITVLSGGAIEPGLRAAAAAFEKQTGHTVILTFNTAPQIVARVGRGDAFDVVVAPPGALAEFVAAGTLDGGGLSVGRVGLGVVVRSGAPVPDISSVDAVTHTVLEADSLVFNQASTGVYFEGLLKKMGVYDRVESKTTRFAGGTAVFDYLAKSTGRAVGFAAITAILLYPEKGLLFVGPLPADIQNYTSYIATPMSAGRNNAVARAFVQFLGGREGKPLFVAAGIE